MAVLSLVFSYFDSLDYSAVVPTVPTILWSLISIHVEFTHEYVAQ